MSAEHQLTPGAAGILGKHPGFGDFIAAGLPGVVTRDLGDWAQTVLGQWRDAMADGWQARFDACPVLRFWIGPAVLGGGAALRGVWLPSRDRAGRRFPLLVVQAGGASPISEPTQDFYEVALLAATSLQQAERFEPRDVVERLHQALPAPSTGTPDWPVFWAMNAARDAPELLAELAAADHAHAMTVRSYWWFQPADRPGAGVLACQGMPGPQELGWLIAGGTPMTNPEAKDET
ncbi:MAG: type VI secretion system-associated protein TagF [Paracoccus sp. (in: a-proteobacteria)]|uniref:type VI secretion system-associated protein TagF n=1 Tax=Paracoccus sp. TaxID=267 RepID=UPI0026DF2AFF|nr:type VI secretion system-associated protein TagF [Paracoccus sp. (in: a-proteobacteria)]MDO5622821.1 type VI secretion system-associated protein TagF [Paracoccus sp. (in: a-proteobacteria)]